MKKLPYDVQRDMAFYSVVIGFRNAVEVLMILRGMPLDPDHMWWGFGGYRRMRPPGADHDGLAGSRVPRRPYGGSGAATVDLDVPPDEVEVT